MSRTPYNHLHNGLGLLGWQIKRAKGEMLDNYRADIKKAGQPAHMNDGGQGLPPCWSKKAYRAYGRLTGCAPSVELSQSPLACH
jgi:hypothetical protein